jgi:hypothetical protein
LAPGFSPIDLGPVFSIASRIFDESLLNTRGVRDRLFLDQGTGTLPRAFAYQVAIDEMRSLEMDWHRVAGNWKQLPGKVKEQWGKLIDDEIDEIAARRLAEPHVARTLFCRAT